MPCASLSDSGGSFQFLRFAVIFSFPFLIGISMTFSIWLVPYYPKLLMSVPGLGAIGSEVSISCPGAGPPDNHGLTKYGYKQLKVKIPRYPKFWPNFQAVSSSQWNFTSLKNRESFIAPAILYYHSCHYSSYYYIALFSRSEASHPAAQARSKAIYLHPNDEQ